MKSRVIYSDFKFNESHKSGELIKDFYFNQTYVHNSVLGLKFHNPCIFTLQIQSSAYSPFNDVLICYSLTDNRKVYNKSEGWRERERERERESERDREQLIQRSYGINQKYMSKNSMPLKKCNKNSCFIP